MKKNNNNKEKIIMTSQYTSLILVYENYEIIEK